MDDHIIYFYQIDWKCRWPCMIKMFPFNVLLFTSKKQKSTLPLTASQSQSTSYLLILPLLSEKIICWGFYLSFSIWGSEDKSQTFKKSVWLNKQNLFHRSWECNTGHKRARRIGRRRNRRRLDNRYQNMVT
jgi:hypothetical protein